MSEIWEEFNGRVEQIAMETVMLDMDDIPAIGVLLNHVTELEELCGDLEEPTVKELVCALKRYVEKIALRERDDPGPLGEAVETLQSICRLKENGQAIDLDISRVLERLGHVSKAESDSGPSIDLVQGEEDPSCMDTDMPLQEEGATKDAFSGEKDSGPVEQEEDQDAASCQDAVESQSHEEVSMSGEDMGPVPNAGEMDEDEIAILEDFILEAEENLGAIEIGIMDLEQNPDDMEIINGIFRPFHTIKGVSGFLNLNRINRLAHSAENLLDKARCGEIRVDSHIIDVILEAVDMLKKMVADVKEGLEENGPLDKGVVDIEAIKREIDAIIQRSDDMANKPIGEILVENGKIDEEDMKEALDIKRQNPNKKTGQILVETGKVESKDVVSALREQKKFSKKHIDLQVKVDTKKLDDLVNMAGELAIVQSMLKQDISELTVTDQKLYHDLGHLGQIVSALQNTAMSMRMVPIKNTFQKMVRLVRDVARSSGKEVNLVMSGEDTEIDRNVVEELYDPMVHMIRNAVDHGIEPPDEREKAGKERKGTVHLKAYHKGGNVIVEVHDDGKGLDRDRILEKARENGLVSDADKLSDSEIYNLIFEPGFSTAKEVTEISGRGVGMDVVRKAIEGLRGRVEINSIPGQGSTFTISLPLTLAIIDGMVTMIGKERFIIPTLSVKMSFKPEREQYSTVEGKGELIMFQGKLIPLLRLGDLFGIESEHKAPWEGLVVTVQHEDNQMCLMLDELLGKAEVVIKNLGETFKNVKGIAGGTILGDGRVGLILDVPGLFELARESRMTIH